MQQQKKLQKLLCNFPSYLSRSPYLLVSLTPKENRFKMAEKCFEDCHYHKALKTFKIQTNQKHDLFNHLQSTLGSLLAMEVHLDLLNIPNWTRPINKVSVRKIINDAIESKNKCIEDIDTIEKTIKDGCHQCKERREKSQNGQNQELLLTPLQEQEILKSLKDVNFEEFDLDLMLDDNILLEPTPFPNPNPQY